MLTQRLKTPGARVYLVRHGETAWSLTGQHTGCTDLALTAHSETLLQIAIRAGGQDRYSASSPRKSS